MLRTILLGDLLPLCTKVLFEGRIEDQFFADGVTGKLPSELVRPLGLLLLSGGVLVVVVILLQFYAVVNKRQPCVRCPPAARV